MTPADLSAPRHLPAWFASYQHNWVHGDLKRWWIDEMPWLLGPPRITDHNDPEIVEMHSTFATFAEGITEFLNSPPTLIWVTPEMSQVLTAAAATFPANTLDTPFRPNGFAWLATPVVLHQKERGRNRALSWGTYDGTDLAGNVWFEAPSDWEMNGAVLPTPPVVLEGTDRFCGSETFRVVLKHLLALNALLHQRVVVRTTLRADRPSLRRAARNGIHVANQEVQVMDLRRPTPSEVAGEHRHIEWSQRWIVDGHWRNQYLPSNGEHRPTWIAPYVKGPDDKPLVTKPRVYRWSR